MPELPRRPSPFYFLMIGSPVLKLCGACWLAFGILALIKTWKGVDMTKDAWFALGGAATWLVVQALLMLAAGDLCIAVVDMHRDATIAREKLDRLASGPSSSAILASGAVAPRPAPMPPGPPPPVSP
jgi:hypothetical protein